MAQAELDKEKSTNDDLKKQLVAMKGVEMAQLAKNRNMSRKLSKYFKDKIKQGLEEKGIDPDTEMKQFEEDDFDKDEDELDEDEAQAKAEELLDEVLGEPDGDDEIMDKNVLNKIEDAHNAVLAAE